MAEVFLEGGGGKLDEGPERLALGRAPRRGAPEFFPDRVRFPRIPGPEEPLAVTEERRLRERRERNRTRRQETRGQAFEEAVARRIPLRMGSPPGPVTVGREGEGAGEVQRSRQIT